MWTNNRNQWAAGGMTWHNMGGNGCASEVWRADHEACGYDATVSVTPDGRYQADLFRGPRGALVYTSGLNRGDREDGMVHAMRAIVRLSAINS